MAALAVVSLFGLDVRVRDVPGAPARWLGGAGVILFSLDLPLG